jgi:hypothetical protein
MVLSWAVSSGIAKSLKFFSLQKKISAAFSLDEIRITVNTPSMLRN